jgi:hypothetical protein
MKTTFSALLASSLCLPIVATASAPIGVALITTTTDVTEPHIAPFVAPAAVDGFEGSHGGWNFEAKNPSLMSSSDKQFFAANSQKIERVLELRREVESSKDRSQLEAMLKKENLEDVDDKLGELSFGTHAASVVVRYSKEANIQLNFLMLSWHTDEEAIPADEKLKDKAAVGVFNDEDLTRDFAEHLAKRHGAMWADTMNKYIRNSGVKIVKSEFVISGINIHKDIDKKWKEMNPTGEPNAKQKENMELAYNVAMNQMQSSWCSLPKNNPNVLFMFPAAHNGSKKDFPGLGDADAIPAYPASCGLTSKNVLVSSPVNDDGSLIDRVDYGRRSIDIAGVEAQSGFVPNGGQYFMHGTCPISNALTGIAAAIWDKHPEYSPIQVKEAILALGTPEKILSDKVASGKYISRQTLRQFDRFTKEGDSPKTLSAN